MKALRPGVPLFTCGPDMEFDLPGEHARYAYRLLGGLVTPRPIAWVTTQDEEGRVNAAPFSFFNLFGADPPILGFAPGDREPGIPKDTARRATRLRSIITRSVVMVFCISDTVIQNQRGRVNTFQRFISLERSRLQCR